MPIRVGIDLVSIDEVAAALGGPHRDRYLKRVFTAREVEDCRGPSGELVAASLAARFAAKEATIKALPGSGEGVPLTAIAVSSGPGREVGLALSGRAAEIAREAGVTELAVSLTHESGLAAATVVVA
jgi:holo-[acyl-carrier protein] synthase